MSRHLLTCAALAAAATAQQSPQLALGFCSAASAASQLFYFDAANTTIVLASAGYCIDVLDYGTTIGSLPYTAPCHHDDKDPTHQNQEFASLARSSSAAAPIIETMSGLSLDACGSAGVTPGALMTLCALQGASAFYLNVSSPSNNGTGTIVHAATGLCIDAGGSAAAQVETLVLNTCAEANTARQVFALAANGGGSIQLATPTINGADLCLTAGGATSPVVAAICAPPSSSPPPIQAFALDAAGHLVTGFSGLVADAGAAPFWAGLSIGLSAASPASAFTHDSSGRLVHTASGLCLDAGGVPTSHGCLDRAVHDLPFCDPTLPAADRVADLVSRLTLAEKIGLTGADLKKDGSCDTKDPGVARLDIPAMQWLVETNSMAASACYGSRCATSFPAALNLAASFNRTSWRAKGETISTEMRALNNLHWTRSDGVPDSMQSLSGFGPDVNQPRDPRNGRAGELPSEDPSLMSAYAVEMVRGMQDSGDPRYVKMISGLKHYAGYSLETGRMGSVGNFSLYDLWDTYLKPFESGFVEGGALGSMCSYISLSIGESDAYVPACANRYLLQTLTREYWGRPDAVHTSDCGAVSNMARENYYVKNDTYGAAAFLNGGADLNSEYTVPANLGLALELGLVNISTVDAAISRTLGIRIRAGLLDPFEVQPPVFWQYNGSDIGAASSAALVQEVTAMGIVLAKNEGPLPLHKGTRIAVVGPLGNCDRCLMGDYYADQVCVGGGFECVPTLASAITAANTGGSVSIVMGVTVSGNDSTWGAALAAVAAADVVLLALGTDNTIGSEGTDLSDIGLPGVQTQFGLAVLAAAGAKPVVLLLVSAFPTSFDELLAPVGAIVLAYAPTFGAPAVAASLFGDANRWGRAVMTIYPRAYQSAVTLKDFGMTPTKTNAGRGYRYYDGRAGAPLISFGQGLSYTTFATLCSGGFAGVGSDNLVVRCNITSTAGPDGDIVLQVFHRVAADIVGRIGGAHPVPLTTLVAFERWSVVKGGVVEDADFQLRCSQHLTLVDATGATVLYPGLHFLDVYDGASANITIPIEVPGWGASSGPRVLKQPPPPPPLA